MNMDIHFGTNNIDNIRLPQDLLVNLPSKYRERHF